MGSNMKRILSLVLVFVLILGNVSIWGDISFAKDNFEVIDLKAMKEDALTWSLAYNEKLDIDYAIAVILSNLELIDIETQMNSHKVHFGDSGKALNTIKNIVTRNDLEYLQDLKEKDFGKEINTEKDITEYIYSMIALNMLDENYDKMISNETLYNEILSDNSKIKDEYIGDAISALDFSQKNFKKNDLVKNIKERLEKDKLNLSDLTSLLTAMVVMGEEIEYEYIEKIQEYKREEGYSKTLTSQYKKDGEEKYVLKFLVTMENKESIYKTIMKKTVQEPVIENKYEIKIENNKKDFKEFDEIELSIKTFKNNFEVDLGYSLVSVNEEVASIDKNNKIIINKPGKVFIKAVLDKDKKIYDEIELNIEKIESKVGEGNIEDFINAISIYYNREHFNDNGGKLNPFEYATFNKLSLSTNRWQIEKDYKPSYDEKLEYVGNKARQAEIMIATGRNPRKYNDRDLINEIVEVLETGKSKGRNFDFAGYPYLLGVLAVNNYNEKFEDEKVQYDTSIVLEKIKLAQQKNGGLIERNIENGIAPRNTALALEIVSKIEGGEDIKDKIINYFKSIQKDNGGFFEKAYVTNYNADIVRALSIAGEDLTNKEWSKGEFNPIESLFYLFRSNNSFKDFVGEDIDTLNNPHERDLDCKVATQAVLEALGEIRKNNGNYNVKTAKISEVKDDIETEIDINTAVLILDKDERIDIKYQPRKLKLNNKKNSAGLTALGALQSTTNNIKMNYGFVEEIEGLRNTGNSGWMYSVNDEIPNLAAAYTKVNEDDKIIWFYVPEEILINKSLEEIMPKWSDLSKGDKEQDYLEEEIEFLKSVFDAYMEEDKYGNTGNAKISLTGTGSAKLAGMDIEKIQKNIYIDKDNKTAYQLSQSIITLIGAELDPRNYNGRNLVDELKNSETEGVFKTSHDGVGSDKESIESQIRSIIALDLAGANYDEQSAIKVLLDMFDKKDSKTYKEVETEGYMLLALSNHTDEDRVEESIKEIQETLSKLQKEDGSYFVKGIGNGGTVGMARVVQGLVATGINPLTDNRFIKNDKTIIDAIIRNKVEKQELKKSGYSKKTGDNYNYATGAHIVFGAFLDVKNQESMFNILALEKENEEQNSKIKIAVTKFIDNNEYEIIFEPKEIEIDRKKYNGELNLIDILNISNIKTEVNGNMVKEIMEIGKTEEEGSKYSGWMVTVNGVFPKKGKNMLMPNEYIVQEGDNIVWSRIFNYDNNILPTMDQIIDKLEKNIDILEKDIDTLVIKDIDDFKLFEGNEIQIEAIGYDKLGNIIPDVDIIWETTDTNLAEIDKKGILKVKKSGEITIIAKLRDGNVKASKRIEIKENEFEVKIEGDLEAKPNKQVDVKATVKNLTNEEKKAIMIITLTNTKNNELVNYSMVRKTLKAREKMEFEAGLLVPKTGNYEVKTLLWDSLEEGNPIKIDKVA